MNNKRSELDDCVLRRITKPPLEFRTEDNHRKGEFLFFSLVPHKLECYSTENAKTQTNPYFYPGPPTFVEVALLLLDTHMTT